MITNTFKRLFESHHYLGSIELFLEEFQKYINPHKLASIRELANLPAEQLKDVLNVMDLALMNQWSRILVRHSYRKQNTPDTIIWYCDELISEHKLIEAEELLRELEQEELPPKTAEKLYFTMAVALMHMQRFGEGFSYMEKCEHVSEDSMNTRWAYYFLSKGEWDTALRYLEEGKKDLKDGAFSYALLTQHFARQGELAKAEHYLKEGLKEHPDYPKLLLEKISLHHKQKQWNQMRDTITQLARTSPYHDFQKMCAYFEAESYYEENQLDLLGHQLTSHPGLRKHTHFKNFNGTKDKPIIQNEYKPAVQKYNFCVPATVEMILSMFSMHASQDEIAASIFDVSGSKISKTIEYLDGKGFYCRIFLGNVERFKRLVDEKAAVMLSLEYPTSSHVQFLTGYDDNLQVLHIQDPNFREPHQLEYQDISKELGNNLALSVAIVPAAQKDKLQFLDLYEHETYKRLMLMTENSDQILGPEDLTFLQEHSEHPLVAIHSIKYLAGSLPNELLENFIEMTEHHLADSHYRNHIIAIAYAAIDKEDSALRCLEKSKGTRTSSYHYVKGRLFYNKGDYPAAASEFKNGIKREPDDYILWSYLAISASHQGQSRDALRFSQIALDINNRDLFPLINHGMVLYDNEKYEEARSFFTTTLKIKKDSGHSWFERARCDLKLGRYHQAERGFKVAIGLDPDVPLPYRELANLYEFVYENRQKAEEVLKDGLVQTGETYRLLLELGEFYERDKQYREARNYYSMAAEKAPEDPEAFVSISALLKEEGKISEFFSFVNELYDQFNDNDEFLINSGKMMWETAIDREMGESYLQQALSYMERGITRSSAYLESALEWYTSLIQGTPFYRRGVEFLEGERRHREDNFLLISYIGCLYEWNGNLLKAKSYQENALALKEDILPLYRLGEIHAKTEEYEKAKGYYQRVIALDPTHEQARLDLAHIASINENKAEELYYLMEAFAINPYCVSVEAILALMDKHSMVEDFLHKVKGLDQKKYDQAFIYDSIAYIYGKLGHTQEEKAYLTKALQHSPEMPQLLHHRVNLFIKSGELKSAKMECLLCIQEHYNSREWFETLIKIYLKTKTITKLSTDLKKLKLSNNSKSIVLMNSAAAYEKVIDEWIEKNHDFEQKGFFKRLTGTTKLSFHLGIAIDLYESAMKLDPENSTAPAWLSDFYLQMSNSPDAIKVLEQAMQSHWDSDLAYKLATLYVTERHNVSEKKQKEYLSKAQSLMERLVNASNEPEHLNYLGFILYLQGRLEEAKGVYEECLKMDPDVDKGYLYLGKVHADLQDYPNAEIAFRNALEVLPGDLYALIELSIAIYEQGRIDEALQWTEQAQELHPSDLYLKYNRASYLASLGRWEESAKGLEEVFDLDEENMFLEMAVDDPDFLPLKEAGLFPKIAVPLK